MEKHTQKLSTCVNILQQGYCHTVNDPLKTNFIADCSVCLITGKFRPILVDTSGPWNKKKLISNINELGFECKDIEWVVCTHGHSDHIGNLNLFDSAKFIVGYDIFKNNIYESFDFKTENAVYSLNNDVCVFATPGHTNADVSVLVKNTDKGSIVIAGDIFENENDFEDPTQWQSLSENIEVQKKSRKNIINLADYIVPGHGKMFEVTKSMKLSIDSNFKL